MSLLNQVLQDLENRNASNSPKQRKINQLKAATATQKNSYSFLIILLCLTASIALINFIVNNEADTAPLTPKPEKTLEIPDTLSSQEPITQPTIIIPSVNKPQEKEQIKIKSEDQESIVKLENQSITTQQPEKKTNSITQQLATKNTLIKTNKKRQTQRNKPYQQKKYITKKISPKQQAEKLFTQAKKEKHKVTLQSTLEQVLRLNPKHRDARLLLANSLLNMGLLQKTIEVLDQGIQLSPQNIQFISFRSQLFLQNNQPQLALNILHRIDSRYNQDEMYLSLLASAYQQNNEALHSLQIYQKLIIINPQKAEYWLGFAIAQEKQGNKAQALKGYQQALDKKTLKKSIVSYIEQRVSSLKRL